MDDTAKVWRDADYLRNDQYRDSVRLGARANLHARHGRGDWFPWALSQHAWPAGAKVLDVGCGAGWSWAQAAERLPVDLDLTLTDLSPGMVAEAVTRLGALDRWDGVRGQVADAGALPFEDASFDAVCAFHMLYHLPDPARGVAEIARVLKPGGVALIATNGRGNLGRLLDLEREVFGPVSADISVEAFGLETGEPILREAFAQVELRLYPDPLKVTDPADVHAYLTSSPPGQTATVAQDAALRAAITAAFAAEGGTLTLEKRVGVFLCRRG